MAVRTMDGEGTYAQPEHDGVLDRTRRAFLRTTVIVGTGGVPLVTLAGTDLHALRADGRPWPHYILRRQVDNVYLQLTAVGYREKRFFGRRCLVPLEDEPNPRLVFTFPPQHFAETAVGVSGIPAVMPESDLNTITLQPSEPSFVVLRDPKRREIKLSLEDLLDWRRLETVLPETDLAGQDVLTQPKYELEVDPAKSAVATRIEMPWGVELTPARPPGGRISTGNLWQHPIAPQMAGSWALMWSTALSGKPGSVTKMEVLSVRGFQKGRESGSEAAGNLRIPYTDKPGENAPQKAPLSNYDRISIGTSLSRRFPYTGRVGPPPVQTALVEYAGGCAAACYLDGRTIPVEQFRLSALGGWLRFDAHWTPSPSCALTGWVQKTSLGRDEHVEVIDAGFLYPFGTPAELVIQSERVFVRDANGHSVAVLIKQAFLQVADNNFVKVTHAETPFSSLTITTKKTPPLDLPPDGNPSTYRKYDFFLPMVNGLPFAFDHAGTDWAGDRHSSAMPMIYVSNKATMANGLIWESGYPYNHSQRDAMCGLDASGQPDLAHTIPTSGDGLKVVDKFWNTADFRFAKYNRSLVALAKAIARGDTSQRIDWIEWARAGIVDVQPTAAVARPFEPRSRTLRIRLEGMGQMSGQETSVLGTYRDTRAVAMPVLDPDPAAAPDVYRINLLPGDNIARSPYLFLLETRALVHEASATRPLADPQRAVHIKESYFNASTGAIPDALFFGIENEIAFGRSATSEGVGGLSVPDTHANTLSRYTGPVGDATFNERRWPGYGNKKAALEAIGRVDFAAYRRTHRKFVDQQPFDALLVRGDLAAIERDARAVMGFQPTPLFALAGAGSNYPGLPTAALSLGDLFGLDAQILPGLTFADIFRKVAFDDAQTSGANIAAAGNDGVAPPLVWKVKLTGLDPILSLVGDGPGQTSLPAVIQGLVVEAKPRPNAEPVSVGMEASLHWENTVFADEEIGPLKFEPHVDTRMLIEAKSKVDLGSVSVSSDLRKFEFQPGKSYISASARFENFSITLFNAIKVNFRAVSFQMLPDGSKDFKTEIGSVDLVGPLAFINQLSSMLSGLGGDQGIKLDLSPQRVQISQTLRFPAQEGQPLFIGPAQVINLTLGWFVMIPLQGRDVLTIGFSVSSREKPLTIFVPPFYGGKAHVLIELTTRGCRLIEVSMEYGALVPVTWTLASGVASLTAGIFYMCEKVLDEAGNLASGQVVLRAFVKAAADLKVAGFINFCGLIYIAMESDESNAHKEIKGTATVSVSIKIGFARISYSFTAEHKESSGGNKMVRNEAGMFRSATAAELATPRPDKMGEVLYAAMSPARQVALRRVISGYQG